jgi:hypothetical protein
MQKASERLLQLLKALSRPWVQFMPILPATQEVHIVGEVQVTQFEGQIAEDKNQ